MKINTKVIMVLVPWLFGCASKGSDRGETNSQVYSPCVAMIETSEEIQRLDDQNKQINLKLFATANTMKFDSTTQNGMTLKIKNNEEKVRYLTEYNVKNGNACDDQKRREQRVDDKKRPGDYK